MLCESMIPGFKQAPQSLGDVLILGLGKSGRIAARYCADLLGTRVNSLTIAAGADNQGARDFVETLPSNVTVEFEHYDISGTYDLCIASPGISQFDAFYTSAQQASSQLISEVEFAWRESKADSKWIAITGTNGKTTTTALCAHILKQCGMNAAAVGNIGDTCLEAVIDGAVDAYVAEVSSYQLASICDFAPNVAVLLNITPDHLHWHHTHENYVAAKARIYENLAEHPGSVAVFDATNDEVRAQVKELKALGDEKRGFAYIPIGCAAGIDSSMHDRCGSTNAAWIEDGMLTLLFNDATIPLVRTDELLIPGAHNASNSLAAASAAIALGADVEGVREGLRTFESLEHRIEPCGNVRGIRCYNDSKATNVDATLKALEAFVPIKPIVLLGGDDKGTSLDELVAAAQQHCASVVCFGAAAKRFLDAFDGADIPVYEAQGMESAFDVALSHASDGDVIVLSPACASFDEFSCFEERGDVFKQLVAQRAAG